MGNSYSDESYHEHDPSTCTCSQWPGSYGYGIPQTPPHPVLTIVPPKPPTPPPEKPPTPPPPKPATHPKSPPPPDPKPSSPLSCHSQPEEPGVQAAFRLLGRIGNYAPTRSFFSLQVLTSLISCTCCPNKGITAVVVAFFGFLSLLCCFTDSDCAGPGHPRFRFLSFWPCNCPCRCNDCHRPGNEARVKWSDILHALISTGTYVLFAVSDQNVMDSLFPDLSRGQKQGLQWSRLLAVFIVGVASVGCPIDRRGVGFAVVCPKKKRSNDRAQPRHKC